jgi:hypothetical protein
MLTITKLIKLDYSPARRIKLAYAYELNGVGRFASIKITSVAYQSSLILEMWLI